MGDAVTTAVLVHDVGPGAGLGHAARMTALARALQGQGITARTAVEVPATADVVVVDSYRRRADDAALFPFPVVVAVDDLDRDLAVDLVIDPNPPHDGSPHVRARLHLGGPRYALLDVPDTVPSPVCRQVTRVLVTTGAADTCGRGAALAAGLRAARPDLEVRLVVGPWGSQAVPVDVTPVVATKLVEELSAADIVVTAAGVTMLESLALGRPTIAVVLSENQRRAGDGVLRAGAAHVVPVERVVSNAVRLCDDLPRRQALASAAMGYVDRCGPRRVAEAICALL